MFATFFAGVWVAIILILFALVILLIATQHFLNVIVGIGFSLFGGPADEAVLSFIVTCVLYVVLLGALVGIGVRRHETLRQLIFFAVVMIFTNLGLYWFEETYGDEIVDYILFVAEEGKALGGRRF